MFCPQCGKQLPDNTNFCPDCGAPKQKLPASHSQKTIVLPSLQLTKSTLTVLILCATMLFILLVLPAMFLGHQKNGSRELVYFLKEYDWPSSIENAADVELLLRMSLVSMLVCLTATVFFALKGNPKACLLAGIANCAVSCIVALAFDGAISSKNKWDSYPCGPIFYFGCALITAIILYRQYKKATGAVGASQPANW